eukprot:CAMPEP_0174250394 /NCGR_PEP_ID=MMETSP0439-20130205/578_1 /TAXON_ID=0 /ORGANISM="Stereomyxa ramosa, Strain Chinc5" /LENGTH=998 /DNA_ID=CAMNT_0015330449 /DNA_START=39 /DNA_END=3035 /DNA_ORIENTATION=+
MIKEKRGKKKNLAQSPSLPSFNESRFRAQVDAALVQIKTILENNRNPQFPADVSHKYDDKYLLANFLTNTSLASQLTCLHSLGLKAPDLKKLIEWGSTRSVTLCLSAEERCKFDHETTREVESPTKYVKETTTNTGLSKTETHKVVTTVTDYYWKFTCEYELFAYRGNDRDDKVVLQGRKGLHTIETKTKSTPRPLVTVRDPITVNITFLLQNLAEDKSGPGLCFAIDRDDANCRTPRRNTDCENAMAHFGDFSHWCRQVHSYFMNTLFPVESGHNLDLSCINDKDIFVPVVPLFEEKPADAPALTGKEPSHELVVSTSNFIDVASGSDVAAPLTDVNLFLSEEHSTLDHKLGEISKVFPDNKKVVTVAEAKMLVVLLHSQTCAQHYYDGINYIEHMLRTQLVAAIGKEVGPKDFSEYMRYHQRKLYRERYQPKAFCYAIRRPDHSPEGVVSIEADTNDGEMADPIFTIVRHKESVCAPMTFPLDAATNVKFYGDRYLHAYVCHRFAGQSASSLQLIARARQFSSFILLVGTIGSATSFEPKYGIIVQNKDELKLPLLLETIPTPKEFRDAIESLSPEQQRFASAYRSMQLAGTLFGVCIIQIKPQLELVLNLPDDSLTKEIALTQDLMELFIRYNIPSDLLSYSGDEDASKEAKLMAVQRHVGEMKEMIDRAKRAELEEEEMKRAKEAEKRRVEEERRRREEEERKMRQEMERMERERECRMMEEKKRYECERCESSSLSLQGLVQSLQVHRSASPSAGGSRGGGARGRGGPPRGGPGRGGPSRGRGAPRSVASISPSVPVSTPVPSITPPPSETSSSAPITPDDSPNKPAEVVMDVGDDEVEAEEDYTLLPGKLDSQFSALDEDAALRATTIKPGKVWGKTSQKGLLSKPTTTSLTKNHQKDEKNKAFDLLDGLTRAGCLPIANASLHVVVAATHCFDNSLMDTVIVDNLNPIEKVERSSLIVASTIHYAPPISLVRSSQLNRVQTYSPNLFAIQN